MLFMPWQVLFYNGERKRQEMEGSAMAQDSIISFSFRRDQSEEWCIKRKPLLSKLCSIPLFIVLLFVCHKQQTHSAWCMWWVILMTQLLLYSLLPSVLYTMVVWEMKTCSWLDSLKTISAGKRNGWKSVKNVVDGACGFDPTKKVPLFFFFMLVMSVKRKTQIRQGKSKPPSVWH